ncbi:hypothetical protein GAY28_33800, partial [Azospirillum brasilense]|nr:hypothetical protein [Azospirillum brasilense]
MNDGVAGDDQPQASGLSLRTGLVLLVMAALLPMLGFAGWTVFRMAETQSAAIERSGPRLFYPSPGPRPPGPAAATPLPSLAGLLLSRDVCG